MNITLLQYNIEWGNTLTNLDRIESMIRDNLENTDLLVLPEMFHCGFTLSPENVAETMNGVVVNWLQSITNRYRVGIIGSIVVFEDNKFYNRLLFVRPKQEIIVYDKRHLFRMGGEDKKYSSGKERVIAEFKGFRIRPLICYDLRFPVWSRNQNDYDILIYVANWPSVRQNAWKSLLVARAIENQCYVVGVNRVGEDPDNKYEGGSAIIDYKGVYISQSRLGEESIINGNVDIDNLIQFRQKFPAYLDSDRFKII